MQTFLRYVARHHIALLALLVALGGTSYAAVQLPKNSVGTQQLKAKSVTVAKLAPQARAKKGPRGARGPVGPQGAAGAQGAVGPQGPTGTVDTSQFYDKTASDDRFQAKVDSTCIDGYAFTDLTSPAVCSRFQKPLTASCPGASIMTGISAAGTPTCRKRVVGIITSTGGELVPDTDFSVSRISTGVYALTIPTGTFANGNIGFDATALTSGTTTYLSSYVLASGGLTVTITTRNSAGTVTDAFVSFTAEQLSGV